MRRLLLSLLLLPLLAQAELAETDWLDLMPPEDQRALETMPEISHDSPETADGFSSQGGLRQREQSLPPVMYSNKTVAKLDGRRIRLGGYPVPLENDAQGRSTLFFLVPYPGACIHVPPPPPNQLVFIRPENPIELGNLWDAYWVHGTVRVDLTENAMATSAYTLELERLELIEE